MQTNENKTNEKNEFISYLEEHDIINHISRVLLKLFEEKEKPADVIEYIRMNWGNTDADISLDELKKENAFLREENKNLTKKFEELNNTLKKLISDNEASEA
ncbi:C-Myc-binding protein, putative [Plasmodium berghei]|uniref:c-Myc-binding protein, putative n=2 Tax=Plasmodium berghei TaxID=5821 RepID=A0A509ARR5_PLABA|nr:C-Myc-binding protein, putative [Plasmodium berghei ANKA]CXJ16419.1 C-Myc-binding protein, putative [Plasmodium berghei]SCM26310.1 C-Myc-binding protein, putative [Plasmodium berghei]SCN28386.1 C-Myc-binding protein, putative [Plasmodium berghei]SCO62582.1 C-Myc-binding protein, putative [Plasmodium berghei]SCO64139.1 C-Myc-binding protein, putative [Plasmodium berghei]|eukprot:XP_034424036.1 C-Myc-binding protein, putative [Plasmodium berghei ANKA]